MISENNKLVQDRIASLDQVDVFDKNQSFLLQVAAKAIKAHAAGEKVYMDFVEEMHKKDVYLDDICSKLWFLPQKQTEEASSVIEFTKMILNDNKFIKVLECSSRGDIRFTPVNAKITLCGKERSIGELYESSKRSVDGRQVGIGEPFAYVICPFTGDKFPAKEAPWLYHGLWINYLSNNPELVKFAGQFDKFSNFFGGSGIENMYESIIAAYVKGDRKRYVAVVECSDWYKNTKRKTKISLFDKLFDFNEKTEEINREKTNLDECISNAKEKQMKTYIKESKQCNKDLKL